MLFDCGFSILIRFLNALVCILFCFVACDWFVLGGSPLLPLIVYAVYLLWVTFIIWFWFEFWCYLFVDIILLVVWFWILCFDVDCGTRLGCLLCLYLTGCVCVFTLFTLVVFTGLVIALCGFLLCGLFCYMRLFVVLFACLVCCSWWLHVAVGFACVWFCLLDCLCAYCFLDGVRLLVGVYISLSFSLLLLLCLFDEFVLGFKLLIWILYVFYCYLLFASCCLGCCLL